MLLMCLFNFVRKSCIGMYSSEVLSFKMYVIDLNSTSVFMHSLSYVWMYGFHSCSISLFMERIIFHRNSTSPHTDILWIVLKRIFFILATCIECSLLLPVEICLWLKLLFLRIVESDCTNIPVVYTTTSPLTTLYIVASPSFSLAF